MPEPARAHVIFRLGDERYAVDAGEVERVVTGAECSPLPGAPPHLVGLARADDEWIPVVDPAVGLGLPTAEPASRTTLVLLRHGSVRYALAVDAVEAAGASRLEDGPDGTSVVRTAEGIAAVLEPGELLPADARVPDAPEAEEPRPDSLELRPVRLVEVRVGTVSAALDVRAVTEVLHFEALGGLGDAPDWVLGTLGVRDATLPVLDLRRLLDEPAPAPDDDSHILRVSLHGHEVGLLVDDVSDVLAVEPGRLHEPPVLLSGPARRRLGAIAHLDDRLLLVLSLEGLLDEAGVGTLDNLGVAGRDAGSG